MHNIKQNKKDKNSVTIKYEESEIKQKTTNQHGTKP